MISLNADREGKLTEALYTQPWPSSSSGGGERGGRLEVAVAMTCIT